VLLYRGGWGNAVDHAPVVAQIPVVLATVAFGLTLLLVPVPGISFWANDRGTRRLDSRLAEPSHDGPLLDHGAVLTPVPYDLRPSRRECFL
jgi:hypothetical protein